mgnify:CR=1 FL=1
MDLCPYGLWSNAQEKHQTQASSTVALGRTLIASQILAANEKGNKKLTVKVLGKLALKDIPATQDELALIVNPPSQEIAYAPSRFAFLGF